MMMTRRPPPLPGLSLLLLGIALAACRPGDEPPLPPPAPQQPEVGRALLEENRARWQAAGAQSYRYTLRRDVEGPNRLDGTADVVVRNGRVEEETGPHLGEAARRATWGGVTVDSLFAYVAHLYRGGADALTVRYDAELGFPYLIQADDSTHQLVPAATTLEVRDFVRLAPPADAPAGAPRPRP